MLNSQPAYDSSAEASNSKETYLIEEDNLQNYTQTPRLSVMLSGVLSFSNQKKLTGLETGNEFATNLHKSSIFSIIDSESVQKYYTF